MIRRMAIAAALLAVTAIWTGRQEQVVTVSGLIAWNCEYQFAGQTFWKVFQNFCPATVEVE